MKKSDQEHQEEKKVDTQKPQDLKIKTLICQLNPKFKDPEHNMKRAEVSLKKYSEKDELDVIFFAEMAFTGYCFKNREDVKPYCEIAGKGKMFEFCSNMAKKVNSYIMAGYPELYIEPET
jgi:protein N-terminal amidase